MTITTVAINCDVSLANNTEFTASQLEFTLSDADYDTISNDSVPAATVVLALDASGVATANLWPVERGTRNTFYRVVLIGTRTINGRATSERFALGNIAPPSTGAPFALADLLGQSTGGIVVGSTIYETLADAVAAAVAAGAAGADPVAATAAAERAEDARDSAQLAQANAELAEAGAEAARDAALLSRGVFASTALGLSNGVAAVTVTGAGSGGANGVFALAFSGGAGTGAAGTFTVASGAVVSVTITHPGTGYTSAPTVSFAASAGLTGVTATVAIAPRNPVGTYFSVPATGDDSLILYRVDAGPAAVEVARYPSSAAVDGIGDRITSVSVLSEGASVAFAIVDPDTGQTPFQVLTDDRASIVNPHFQQVEADATEAMEGRVKINPTDQALSWGVVQSKANGDKAVLLGVRSTDGRIINPAFAALWDAVFGGAVASGSLLEADSIIMHGPRIYAVDGRAFDLFGPSLLPTRNNGFGYLFGLQSVRADGVTLQQQWREQARIRCDDLGSTATFKLINDGLANTEFVKLVTVVKSAISKTATPRAALIGDSITAGSYLKTSARFAGYGVTPYFMGTRRTNTGLDVWAEGRGGWGAIDYCYDRTDFVPLPAGQEATALASGSDNRNPFIRLATGGDDPAKVRNGYIFDYRFYLDRFSFADPDIVVINLGTNDINALDWPTGFPKARDCIDIMVDQIKAACPGVIIGLAQAQKGNNIFFNPRWVNGWAALFLHWHQRYGASSDVHVLSSHAMLTDRMAVPTNLVSTNAQTGQTKRTFVSDTHPDDFVGYDAYAESIFSFIHAIA